MWILSNGRRRLLLILVVIVTVSCIGRFILQIAVKETLLSVDDVALKNDTFWDQHLKDIQLENYRRGNGLILNVHITHHAGTSVCHTMGLAQNVPGQGKKVPDFACISERKELISNGTLVNTKQVVPWQGINETSSWISKLRPYFHMMSWEFDRSPSRKLNETDWENPNLVSVLVIRHPISRLLAGDGGVLQRYNGAIEKEPNETLRHQYWWDYANGPYNKLAKFNTNNFALRILSEDECCDGRDTSRTLLEQAKALIRRFTVILDIDCLPEGLQELGKVLNLTLDCASELTCSKATNRHAARPSYADRIGFDDVYQFLLEKNKLDIELYEWARELSLVQCQPDSDNSTTADPPTSVSTSSLASTTTSPQPGRALKEEQIQNYIQGTALILNLHITHHAGTAFCNTVGRAKGVPGVGKLAPSFVCMQDNDNTTNGMYEIYGKTTPWDGVDETAMWIKKIRPFYHMISWEYGDKVPGKSMSVVNWEDPNLISVVIMRHPIDRLLAGDASVWRKYPGLQPKEQDVIFHHPYETNETIRYQYWWDYANGNTQMARVNSNNFALRILSDPKKCCEGNRTDRTYLDQAKSLLDRFTFVLDQACLSDGMEALGKILNLDPSWKSSRQRDPTAMKFHERPSYRERIGFDDVYEFLVQKNKLDIELYEWSKGRSLVRCQQ